MADKVKFFQERKRMTLLGEALAKKITLINQPIITDYNLFSELWAIYKEKTVKYLRGDVPSKDLFERTRYLLSQENIIKRDDDYSRMWRITSVSDRPSDEVVCIADPFCYISHISAMQRYGLTERRPDSLFITQPNAKITKSKIAELVQSAYGEALQDNEIYIQPLRATNHPAKVRKRPVARLATVNYGESVKVKGTPSRIATIGQTFLDMLDEPDRCGGMLHALETWKKHAPTYLDEVIERIDRCMQPIQKVRAGYILEDRLEVSDPRVIAWKAFAQRGSSRVLDPSQPFADTYSEDWMLSINVG